MRAGSLGIDGEISRFILTTNIKQLHIFSNVQKQNMSVGH